MAKELLEKGVPVNVRHRRGSTPLHSTGKYGMVVVLVDKGVDVNIIINAGDSLLYLAETPELKGEEFTIFARIVKYLRNKGAVSHVGTAEQRKKASKRFVCEMS